MKIDPLSIAAVIVALITALGAWASHRSSAKAAIQTAKETAEVDAYNRARKMDIETIKRQDDEIDELRGECRDIKKRVVELEEENFTLRRRVATLEKAGEDGQQTV